MARLDSLSAEPISPEALNSAVKAEGSPTRHDFERTAVAVRNAWKQNVELSAAVTAATSARQVAEGKMDGVGRVLQAGGNYEGNVLSDVAELRAYALQMRELRLRMLVWARESASKQGQEGAAIANTLTNFLDGIESPAVLGP